MHTFLRSFIMVAISLITFLSTGAYAAEPALTLKYKARVLKTEADHTILNPSLAILDINKDTRNEVAISDNGYIQVFEWTGSELQLRWKSRQYSTNLGSLSLPEVSPLINVSYFTNNKLETDYLFFTYISMKPGPVSADIYKLNWQNNKYLERKVLPTPFNRFDRSGKCADGSSLVVGHKAGKDDPYTAIYKWDGTELVEKWQGSPGTKIIAMGTIKSPADKLGSAFLTLNIRDEIGLLSCAADSIEWKRVGKKPSKIDLWENNRVGYGRSLLGFTDRSSVGELWSIQGSNSEGEYNAKVYRAKFDGKQFSPFSRIKFKGIDSDMIFDLVITDIDNDGIGEILGVEEVIRKVLPRKHPEDETDTLLITSNLFLAKWNGAEYEVKWHQKAIDNRIKRITVEQVTDDKEKSVIIIDDEGYLYLFAMPNTQK